MLNLALIFPIAFTDALDIAGGPFDYDTLLGRFEHILHIDLLDLPGIDSDLFHEQFLFLGDLALVPFVPDFRASPIQIFQQPPYENVDYLVIHILVQVLSAFLALKQDLVVDGPREGMALREICPLSPFVKEVHPSAQPHHRDHAVAR